MIFLWIYLLIGMTASGMLMLITHAAKELVPSFSARELTIITLLWPVIVFGLATFSKEDRERVKKSLKKSEREKSDNEGN